MFQFQYKFLKLLSRSLLVFLYSVVVSCGGSDKSSQKSPPSNKLKVHLPDGLHLGKLPSNGSLQAYIRIDNEIRQPMVIVGSGVGAQATASLTGVTVGMHTITIEFYFNSNEFGNNIILSRVSREIDIGAGHPDIEFSPNDYDSSFDTDKDGRTNINELKAQLNPLVAHIAEGDVVAVASQIPNEIINAVLPENSALRITLSIDGGEERIMNVSESLASFSVQDLTVNRHDFKIRYYLVMDGAGEGIPLLEIDQNTMINSGSNTPDFSSVTPNDNFDTDGDNSSNLEELMAGTPILVASNASTSTPTPTLTPTPVLTSTLTPTPVLTPTLTPTPVLTPTLTPTPVLTPTLTPTPVLTPTLTPTPVLTPTLTPTPTPVALMFDPIVDVPINTVVLSNTVVLGELSGDLPISIEGGMYRLNGEDFTAEDGVLTAGDSITLQLTSSESYLTSTSIRLMIDGTESTFTVTTSSEPDLDPVPFSFSDITNMVPGASSVLDSIIVQGIAPSAEVMVSSNAAFQINGGEFISGTSTINNNETLTIRVVAPEFRFSTDTVRVTVGNYTTEFSVSTGERPDFDIDDDGLIEINRIEDLNEIRNNLDGTALYGTNIGCPLSGCIGFELTRNIDFDTNGDLVFNEEDSYWNNGLGWEAIGAYRGPFTGVFEGNGYEIRNLVINRPESSGNGLFSSLENASVRNFVLTGPLSAITSWSYVGSVAARSKNSNIAGVVSTLNIKGFSHAVGHWNNYGADYIGGIVGEIEYPSSEEQFTSIENTIFYGSIRTTGSGEGIGGIVGRANGFAVLVANISSGRISIARGSSDQSSGILGSTSRSLDSHIIGENYWVSDYSSITQGSVGSPVTLVDIQCRSDSNSANSCPNAPLENWQNYTNLDGVPYWDFGNANQTPGLILGGRVIRDSDYDGVLDEEDAFPSQYAAAIDRDLDGHPDIWTIGCHEECRQNSSLIFDRFPNDAMYAVDDDWDGIPDITEDPSNLNDTDNDGVPNTTTVLPNGSIIPGDIDTNGILNVDTDNDGLVEINSLSQLNNIRHNLTGSGRTTEPGGIADTSGCPTIVVDGIEQRACIGYELTTDLDFDSDNNGFFDFRDEFWNGGLGWQPIGKDSTPFNAIFNGNGFAIRNMYINRGSFGVALFSATTNSQLKNVALIGGLSSITGDWGVASLVGYADATDIQGVFSSIALSNSGADTGGIVGSSEWTTVSASAYTGSIEYTSETNTVAYIGGIVGNLFSGGISASFSTGEIGRTDLDSTGGLLGSLCFSCAVGIESYWALDLSGVNTSGVGTGVSLSELQCRSSSNSVSDCPSAPLTDWNQLLNDDGNSYWDFGTSNQLPGLNLGTRIYRDSNGDGVLD